MDQDFLQRLRRANKDRQVFWDSENKISGLLGILFRSNEMVGEAGEAANEIKKYIRERMDIRGSRTSLKKISDELADVVICVDLIAELLDIDLKNAITNKFNQTSENVNIDVRL